MAWIDPGVNVSVRRKRSSSPRRLPRTPRPPARAPHRRVARCWRGGGNVSAWRVRAASKLDTPVVIPRGAAAAILVGDSSGAAVSFRARVERAGRGGRPGRCGAGRGCRSRRSGGGKSFVVGAVELALGPLGEERLDEALGLAVGLGPVGPAHHARCYASAHHARCDVSAGSNCRAGIDRAGACWRSIARTNSRSDLPIGESVRWTMNGSPLLSALMAAR